MRRLYYDLQQGCLVHSLTSNTPYLLSPWFAGATEPVAVYALTPTGDPVAPYTIQVIQSLSLSLTYSVNNGRLPLATTGAFVGSGDGGLVGVLTLNPSVTLPTNYDAVEAILAADLVVASGPRHIESRGTLKNPAFAIQAPGNVLSIGTLAALDAGSSAGQVPPLDVNGQFPSAVIPPSGNGYVVAGAGQPQVNGVYLLQGLLNGRPWSQKPRSSNLGDSDYDSIFWNTGNTPADWEIRGADGVPIYVSEDDVAEPSLVTNWAPTGPYFPAPAVTKQTGSIVAPVVGLRKGNGVNPDTAATGADVAGALADTATLTGATPVLDWNKAGGSTLTLSANATVSFANAADGHAVDLTITNPGNYTVTWPAGVKWIGTPPVQTTGGTTDRYEFKQRGGVVYGAAYQGYPGPLQALLQILQEDSVTELHLPGIGAAVADGTVLSSIPDQSGHGYSQTQADATKRPTYRASGIGGRPVYHYTGGSAYNSVWTESAVPAGTFSNGTTWIHVWQKVGAVHDTEALVSRNATGGSNANNDFLRFLNYRYVGGGSGNYNSFDLRTATTPAILSQTANFARGVAEERLGNRMQHRLYVDPNFGDTSTALTIGTRADRFPVGEFYLGAFAAYPSELSTKSRRKKEAALAAYYGISLAPPTGSVNLVCHGDSMTWMQFSDVTRPWVTTVANAVQAGLSNGAVAYSLNRGINGQGFTYVYPQSGVAQTLTQDAPDWVDAARIDGAANKLILFAGTNDIALGGLSGAQAYSAFVTYFQARLAAGWLASEIYVIKMLPRDGVEAQRTAYNSAIDSGAVTYGYKVITPGASIFAAGANTGSNYRGDHIHLNDAGNDILAGNVQAALNP